MLAGLRRSLFQTLSRRVFYGWVILPVAAITMFGTGPGQSHLIGLFFDPLSQELGLTRTSLAAAYGSATLIAAFLLPKLGSFIDRVGPMRMLWILTLGLGAACILFSQTPTTNRLIKTLARTIYLRIWVRPTGKSNTRRSHARF